MTTTSSDPEGAQYPISGSEEDRRIWALREAKRILTKSSPFGGNVLSTIDLIHLATFILTGEDAFDATLATVE